MKFFIIDKIVVILVVYIYGKLVEMDSIIDIVRERNIFVIEDCVEFFCGFDWLGNSRIDLVFFSFGVIKFLIVFGGVIVKIRDDELFEKMLR